MRFLYDDSRRTGEDGTLIKQISAPDLLGKLGVSVDKQTHVLLRQVTAALRQAGWHRFRSSRADRPWMFQRPEGEAGTDAGASGSSTGAPAPQTSEDADACPF